MTRWASAAVAFGGLSRPADLVAPMAVDQVFTRRERLRCGRGRTLQHWAGRLAAKRAVVELLGLPVTAERLAAVEVLPQPSTMCERSAACLHGHPPGVRLRAPLDGRLLDNEVIRVSISHTGQLAVAVALVGVALAEDRVARAAEAVA